MSPKRLGSSGLKAVVKVEEEIYLNALRLVPGLGSGRLSQLLAGFPGAKGVWQARPEELARILGPGKQVEALTHGRTVIEPEREWEKLLLAGIRVTTLGSSDYPSNLAEIYNPPLILYYRGSLDGLDLSLAIVGSRQATPYGRVAATTLARDMGAAGFAIVSGFARGVDSAAHRGALNAQARTVAVFGCGLDTIYPRENRSLCAEIIERGAVVSDFPLGVQPLSANFPARNRIISGLSLGTLVVEGREKSGSLITADFALEQGRDVFAVPGPINSEYSRGPHKLLKQGAKLVESAGDILEEYAHLVSPALQIKFAEFSYPAEYTGLMEILSLEPLHVDVICRKLKTAPEKLAALLLQLELSGRIRQLSGGYYVRNFL